MNLVMAPAEANSRVHDALIAAVARNDDGEVLAWHGRVKSRTNARVFTGMGRCLFMTAQSVCSKASIVQSVMTCAELQLCFRLLH